MPGNAGYSQTDLCRELLIIPVISGSKERLQLISKPKKERRATSSFPLETRRGEAAQTHVACARSQSDGVPLSHQHTHTGEGVPQCVDLSEHEKQLPFVTPQGDIGRCAGEESRSLQY